MSNEYLWTPWRMQYIAGAHSGAEGAAENEANESERESDLGGQVSQPGSENKNKGCIFCDRVHMPESRDRESLILLRGDHSFVILNRFPYNSAHLMVVPYEHTADFAGLDAETAGEMLALSQRMVRLIDAEYHPQGFNLGMNLGNVAGAGVADHLHIHVVPRWAGDTNFMPVVGATKVMPELLETTYDRLKARLDQAG